MVDGILTGVQASLEQACRDMGLCDKSTPYVGGAVLAGVLFWVAYHLRGDSEQPTQEQVAAAGELVVQLCKERLEGARMMDMDNIPTASEARH